ncbi:unnamed protein product, partial [Cuscuta europaea]
MDPRMKDITWNATNLSFLDSRTNACEQEIQKIIHLQNVANQLPAAFTDSKKVTKSHIPTMNAPSRIEIHVEINERTLANESMIRKKRGRPLGSRDLKPRKFKKQDVVCDAKEVQPSQEENEHFENIGIEDNINNNDTSKEDQITFEEVNIPDKDRN